MPRALSLHQAGISQQHATLDRSKLDQHVHKQLPVAHIHLDRLSWWEQQQRQQLLHQAGDILQEAAASPNA